MQMVHCSNNGSSIYKPYDSSTCQIVKQYNNFKTWINGFEIY